MNTEERFDEIRKEREKWEEKVNSSVRKMVGIPQQILTESGIPVKWIYTPEDLKAFDYLRDLNFPSEYPYTRGVYATMHRARPWTVRLVSGFASGKTSNEQLKSLIESGETGINVVVDMPAHQGYDCDDPRARGEVGREGVSISSLQDMEELFEGIPIDKLSVSLVANATAPIIMAMYIVLAEKRGLTLSQLEGSIQNDVLKEYEVVGTSYIFPPEPALKMAADVLEYCTRYMLRWNTVTFNGHCVRENMVIAAQEIAFVLSNAKVYIKAAIERELDIDQFAPRLAFFLGAHSNFFEEIAKWRAARRLWAKIMREDFKAKDPRSWLMRAAAGCNGSTLTSQQPYNNIVRTAFQALAAVLGGCQSLFTTRYDEGLGLPTEEASRISLATQNILIYETGVRDTIDPLGGSYYVESLTNMIEDKIVEYMRKIEKEGGVLEAIKRGFFAREVNEAAMKRLKQIEKGEKVVVGQNKFVIEEEVPVEVFKIDPRCEDEQREKLTKYKQKRDVKQLDKALTELRKTAKLGENIIPAMIEAVKAEATLGEMSKILKEVYGTYRPSYVY